MEERALTWSQKKVLTHLREHGPSTGKELREGCHQEDWRKRISELRAMGDRRERVRHPDQIQTILD